MAGPLVSVVIPVYRDWRRLESCLAALAAQTLPRAHFEILVVDNDDEPLAEARRPSGVQYLHEPVGFSYAARNAGWRAARAPVLAFTDADCLPSPDWLRCGLAHLDAHAGAGIVGGRIEVVPERDTLAARYDTAFGLRQDEFFRLYRGLATANLFARRGCLEAVNGFDMALESGGDFDFCQRAAIAGVEVRYAPEIHVRHPARETFGELVRQARRTSRGVVEYSWRRMYPTRAGTWRAILQAFRPRVVDWYYALAGGRGSEVLPPLRRPGVLAVRIALHYVIAVELAVALSRSKRARGWP